MSFREIWNGPSFLERKSSACRMRARDVAGKITKKHKKHKKMRHANEDFWKVWEDENK